MTGGCSDREYIFLLDSPASYSLHILNEAMMLLRVLTLIVFGHVQIGFRSNALPVEDKGYRLTPGIGYHKVHRLATTWTEARLICQEEGGDLAIINSENELQAILNLFLLSLPHIGAWNDYCIHIGWHDPSGKGHYVTIENQTLTEAGFEKWFGYEPSNPGLENCGSFCQNGRLNDILCNFHEGFACERPESVIEPVRVEVASQEGPFDLSSEIGIARYVVRYPIPTVKWYKDGNIIQTRNRIKIAAPIKVNIAMDKGPFFEGSEIHIACNIDGYPTPEVQWYKGGNIIQTNSRITINSATNSLTISNAVVNDSGRYRCEATNEYASSAHTVDIVVHAKVTSLLMRSVIEVRVPLEVLIP